MVVVVVVEPLPILARRRTVVVLSRCDRLTDAALLAAVARCPGLTELTVWNCSRLTDASIVAVAERCRNHLAALDVWNCGQ